MDEKKEKKQEFSEEELSEVVKEENREDIRDVSGKEIVRHAENVVKTGERFYGEGKQVYGAVKKPYDVAKERYNRFQSERREQELKNLEVREAEVSQRYELTQKKERIRQMEKEERELRTKPTREAIVGVTKFLQGIGERHRKPTKEPRYYQGRSRGRARPPRVPVQERPRFGSKFGEETGPMRMLMDTGGRQFENGGGRFERREQPSRMASMLHGTGSGSSSLLSGGMGGKNSFPDFGFNTGKKKKF